MSKVDELAIDALGDAFPSRWTEMVGTKLHGKKRRDWILTVEDIRLVSDMTPDQFRVYISTLG